MPDTYNSKVVLSTGEVLIDLTSDTVTASNLLAGETAHNRSGEPVTGTVNLNNYVLKSGDTMTGTLVCPALTKTWGNASSDFEKEYNVSSNGFAFTSKSESSSMYGASYEICQHDSLGLYLANGDGSSEHPITKSITLYTHDEGLVISKNGSTKSKITSDALQVNTHDLLKLSPYLAQMFATAIPANSDLNTTNFLKCGQYYVNKNNIASTLSNCPTALAFKMTVETVDAVYDDETTNSWALRTRTVVDYSGAQYVSFAYVNGTAGVWTYGGWKRVATTDDIQSVTDISSSGNITTATSMTYTGKSLTFTSAGWWAIEGYLFYANGAPQAAAICQESNNIYYELDYAERHTVYDKTVGYLKVSFTGYFAANDVVKLFAKYANASSNSVGIRAKKLH